MNYVVLTLMNQAPDNLDYAEHCIASWQYWCDKNNVNLVVIDKPIQDTSKMKPTWQRWHIFDLLDNQQLQYDQIALIDVDTLIHPNAPSIFDHANGRLGVVHDDLMVEWVHNSIKGYKDFWPDVDLTWTNYFNCGVVVLNKEHKQLCSDITKFYYENAQELKTRQHHTVKKGSDQTPVNYMAKKSGVEVGFLDKRFNFTHLHQRGVLNEQIFNEVGWIYHFNGFEKTMRNQVMAHYWNVLKKVI